MALVLADRVKESTTTTGTGAVTLGGAFTGFRAFSVIGNGNTTYYTISDSATGDWEVGIGTYTSASNSLSRDTVLSSSNAGALVAFAAGTKEVIITQPSGRAVYVDGTNVAAANSATIPNALLANSSVTVGSTAISLGGTATTLAGLTSVASTGFTGALTGNASTATTLQTARTIAISGAVTGTATSFNGSANITIPTTVSTTQGGVVYGGSATAYATTATGTTGYILTANGTSAPSWAENSLLSFPESSFKKAVLVATTAALTVTFSSAANTLTNAGTLAALNIDGVALAVGDRVLVKNQASALQNGIYAVTTVGSASVAWVLTRTTDANTSSKLASALVAVDAGATNGGDVWTTVFKSTDTLNTTAMPWYEMVFANGTWAISISGNAATATSATSATTASTATALATGRTISLTGDVSYTSGAFDGTANVTGTATLASTGVTANTYASPSSVTVDAKGRITAITAGTSSSVTITDDTTTAATYYPLIATATSGTLTAARVSSTKFTFNPSTGTLTATVMTANSDERLKTNWRGVGEDFVDRLATIKSGVYDRVDTGETHAGSSAQDWQKLLPQAVVADHEGMLSLAYGNAALVAAVELAKRVVEQEARINRLEALVAKLTGG